MRSSRRGERHAETPHRICGCDVHGARSRGEGSRTAEESGDQVTGDEVSKPWIAEGLRSGSAKANHRERSEHGSEVLRRSCRNPRAAERDACDSIPRVAGFQPCEPYPESEIPME